MLNKLTFVAGLATGYVLGAKAGTERYTQIEARLREITGLAVVQDAANTVKQTATDLVDTARTSADDALSSVTDRASSRAPEAVIDLSSPLDGAPTTAPAPPRLMAAGAAPSAAAPAV